ncbi:MAG: phage holin family protein [Bacilli bacterium]|nr:phage holin family protein [Bacilli bacterium]
MHLIIREKNKVRLNSFVEWLIYMFGYTIVFILVTSLFKSVIIEEKRFFIWSFIIVLIISMLNKTIKPVLVTLTIPITALTLGLFYPLINVFILKLTDWILRSHFDINNFFAAFFIAILLSITNFIVEKTIKRLIERLKKNG